MSISELIAAIVFAFVTSITPGPNNTMLMASGMRFGFTRTIPHIFGISLGFPIMLLAVGIGFGRLFEKWPAMHYIPGMLGAAYLLYFAWQIAWADLQDVEEQSAARPMTLFQAAAFQWVNPKAWIIATGAVTALLKPESFVFGSVALAMLYGVVSFPCVALWAAGGDIMARALTRPWQRRIFSIILAVLLSVAVLMPIFMGAVHTRI